jgi:hypothetical protein
MRPNEKFHLANFHRGIESGFVMDAYGRFLPSATRFPSAAGYGGFKALGDYLHAEGLKFGIHILRGIPKGAVAKKLPIADSAFHAQDAADLIRYVPVEHYTTTASRTTPPARLIMIRSPGNTRVGVWIS